MVIKIGLAKHKSQHRCTVQGKHNRLCNIQWKK